MQRLIEPALDELGVTGQPELHRRPLHVLEGRLGHVAGQRVGGVVGVRDRPGPIDRLDRRHPLEGVEEPHLPIPDAGPSQDLRHEEARSSPPHPALDEVAGDVAREHHERHVGEVDQGFDGDRRHDERAHLVQRRLEVARVHPAVEFSMGGVLELGKWSGSVACHVRLLPRSSRVGIPGHLGQRGACMGSADNRPDAWKYKACLNTLCGGHLGSLCQRFAPVSKT